MGTARAFDALLKKTLNIHAAWLPITNTFELGDFGLMSDGVLAKMGNIKRDFGIGFVQARGKDSKLDFVSKGTRVVRVAAGVQVNPMPDIDVDAKLTVEFGSKSAFLAKATLSVVEMQDRNQVAQKLAVEQSWQSKFRVVSSVYTGRSCSIISSKDANSKIELSGKAKALRQLDLASASADIEVTLSENIGVQIVGATGAIGLALFKLRWLVGGPKILARSARRVAVESDENWPAKLPDDV